MNSLALHVLESEVLINNDERVVDDDDEDDDGHKPEMMDQMDQCS